MHFVENKRFQVIAGLNRDKYSVDIALPLGVFFMRQGGMTAVTVGFLCWYVSAAWFEPGYWE
jgi:hypothetical protein